MSNYFRDIDAAASLVAERGSTWDAISLESVARMKTQNQFKTGLDIARYTANIMREDMDRYDADPANYTQSLGCWHGFIGQQKMISIKKHFGSTKGRYLYLSGWMVAALRSEFGPCGRSRVSEVLNRKRSLSMSQIRKLHDGLNIPLENLIGAV